MEKEIYEIKKEALDNAVKTYEEFKKLLPRMNNKIVLEMMSDDQSKIYRMLIHDIWRSKDEYRNELKIENKKLKEEIKSYGPIMDYNNKDLFILYGNHDGFDYDYSAKFVLVGIKENDYIKLGLSICNANDNFSKKFGRELAHKRAVKGKWSIPLKADKPVNIRKYLQELVNDIDENIDWYRKNCI